MHRSIRLFGSELILLALAGCFYGFAGGGLPSHIHSVAILPFDNQTASADLQHEIHDALRKDVEGRLGLRDAAENRADAILRGTIVRYDIDVPVSFSANSRVVTTARRKLQLTVDVEIVDQTTGKTLFSRKGLLADAEYAENGESDGRKQAIQKLVNEVIEGAQSQW